MEKICKLHRYTFVQYSLLFILFILFIIYIFLHDSRPIVNWHDRTVTETMTPAKMTTAICIRIWHGL